MHIIAKQFLQQSEVCESRRILNNQVDTIALLIYIGVQEAAAKAFSWQSLCNSTCFLGFGLAHAIAACVISIYDTFQMPSRNTEGCADQRRGITIVLCMASAREASILAVPDPAT